MEKETNRRHSNKLTALTAAGAWAAVGMSASGATRDTGEPPHRYHFQVFALDTVLRLPAGFNRHALIEAMRGHVLAKGEMVGAYQRRP